MRIQPLIITGFLALGTLLVPALAEAQMYIVPGPVYAPPPPPVYYGPPPMVMAPPPPPPVAPRFTAPQWGIGLDGTALSLSNSNNSIKSSETGGDFLLRFRNGSHISSQLSLGGLSGTQGSASRSDTLIQASAILDLFPRSPLSLYFTANLGLDFGHVSAAGASDQGTLGVYSAGAGLELRLGRLLTFNGELRGVGTGRFDSPSQSVTSGAAFGSALTPLVGQSGAEGLLGVSLFF